MIKLIRFLLILFLAFSFCFWGWGKCTKEGGTLISEKQERLKEKADSAKVYCVKNGLNTNYCFLVDFSIHSGKKRFLSGTLKAIRFCVPVFVLMDMGRIVQSPILCLVI